MSFLPWQQQLLQKRIRQDEEQSLVLDEYKTTLQDLQSQVESVRTTLVDMQTTTGSGTGGTAYTTQQMDLMLDNYYTKVQVDNLLTTVQGGGSTDLSSYYTKAESDAKVDELEQTIQGQLTTEKAALVAQHAFGDLSNSLNYYQSIAFLFWKLFDKFSSTDQSGALNLDLDLYDDRKQEVDLRFADLLQLLIWRDANDQPVQRLDYDPLVHGMFRQYISRLDKVEESIQNGGGTVDLSGYATIASFPVGFDFAKAATTDDIDDKIDHFALNGLQPAIEVLTYTKTQLNDLLYTVENGVTINNFDLIAGQFTTVNTRLDSLETGGGGGAGVDLSAYYTGTVIDGLFTSYYTKSEEDTTHGNLQTQITDNATTIAAHTTAIQNLETATQSIDLSAYATLLAVDAAYQTKTAAAAQVAADDTVHANFATRLQALETANANVDLTGYLQESQFPEGFVFENTASTTYVSNALGNWATNVLPAQMEAITIAEIDNYQQDGRMETAVLNFVAPHYQTSAEITTQVNGILNTYRSGTLPSDVLVTTYSKAEIDTKVANAASNGTVDLSNYYNKSEIDAMGTGMTEAQLATYLFDNGFIDQSTITTYYVRNQIYEMEKQTLQGRLTNVETRAVFTPENYYTKTEVDAAVAAVGTVDLSAYYQTPYIDALEGRIATLEGQVAALLTRLNDYESNVTQLGVNTADLGVAAGKIAQNETDIAQLQTDVGNVVGGWQETRVAQIESDLAAVQAASWDEARVAGIETTQSTQATTLADHESRVAANETAIAGVVASSWDETRVAAVETKASTVEAEIPKTRLVLHQLMTVAQKPLVTYSLTSYSNRQIGQSNNPLFEYQDTGTRFVNFTVDGTGPGGTLQDSLGIAGAYFIEASDIVITNYSWDQNVDNRIGQNPQFRINVQGLRDKINASVESFQHFFAQNDPTKTNADFFMWSIKVHQLVTVERDTSDANWVAWHVIQEGPINQSYISDQEIATTITNNPDNQVVTWYNNATGIGHQWIGSGSWREQMTFTSESGRMSLQDKTSVHVGLMHSTNWYLRMYKKQKVLVEVLLHPRGTYAEV